MSDARDDPATKRKDWPEHMKAWYAEHDRQQAARVAEAEAHQRREREVAEAALKDFPSPFACTVADLRAQLADLPDDMPVLVSEGVRVRGHGYPVEETGAAPTVALADVVPGWYSTPVLVAHPSHQERATTVVVIRP